MPETTTQVAAFISGPVEGSRTPALRALWRFAHGYWQAAHRAVQDDTGQDSAWVHAMLHREEGDHVNAAYWYGRAGRPVGRGPVEQERDYLLATLLRSQG